MKTRSVLATSLLIATLVSAPAASLMLDFGATAVASPYLTLSPGHDSGWIPASQTTWNTITTSADRSDLNYSNNTAATGVTLVLGQEASGGNNIINYSTNITNTNLAGSGGGTGGWQNLRTSGSIYGNDASSTAVGRDGFFGGGVAATTGTAIGFRVDGLAAGDYRIYLMGRNTNTNSITVPINFYTTTGVSAGTFDFSSLTAVSQQNTTYTTATYVDQFNAFVAGENMVFIDFTIGAGESLFVASDGGLPTENRGFLNMAQIVPIPEPGAALLGALGMLVLLRRRRA